MQFGLALSSGGLRGVAHIGVLKALEEEHLYPSWISGTSAGSIVAGLYACGYSPNEIEDIVLKIDRKIFDPNVNEILRGITRLIRGIQPSISGIINGTKFEKQVRVLTKGRNIRDSKIPIAITGVDINSGKTIYFVSNKNGLSNNNYNIYIDDIELYKAIRASISLPVIFTPKHLNGLTLVDGGINDNLPINILKQLGARRIIGVNLGYSGQLVRGVDNIIEIGNQSIDIMQYQITRLRNIHANFIINPHIYDVGLTDFSKIPECIERGYQATKRNIRLIRRAII